MVVWLRYADVDIGISDGIVSREAFQRLATLDEARQQVDLACGRRLRAAETEAARMLAAARNEADALQDKARRDARAATRLGYAVGRRQALEEWHAKAATSQREAQAIYERMRDKLAGMVIQAVSSLVTAQSPEAYFEASLAALDRLAEDSRMLTLTVHPDDRAAAESALAALDPRWTNSIGIAFTEDSRLARRSCICESDTGWIDAGLEVQLRALRRTVQRSIGLHDEVIVPASPRTREPHRADESDRAMTAEGPDSGMEKYNEWDDR